MLSYRSHGLSIVELWFDEPVPPGRLDIIRYHQRPEPLPGGTSAEFHTLMVDLTRPDSEILAGMTKGMRYEIKRAYERDGILCEVLDTRDDNVLDRFCSAYNTFAKQKRLSSSDPEMLRRLAQNGILDISSAAAPLYGDLAFHVYIVCSGRARLLHSASVFRSSKDNQFKRFVGRANRYLHWHDMLRFKANKIAWYDFGGWYAGCDDQEKLSINMFKEAFGGIKRIDFNGEVAVTVKAKAAISIARLIGRRRH